MFWIAFQSNLFRRSRRLRRCSRYLQRVGKKWGQKNGIYLSIHPKYDTIYSRCFFFELSYFETKKRWFVFPCWHFAEIVRAVPKVTAKHNNWTQNRKILRLEVSFGSRTSFRSIFKHIRNWWKAISLKFAGPFCYDLRMLGKQSSDLLCSWETRFSLLLVLVFCFHDQNIW